MSDDTKRELPEEEACALCICVAVSTILKLGPLLLFGSNRPVVAVLGRIVAEAEVILLEEPTMPDQLRERLQELSSAGQDPESTSEYMAETLHRLQIAYDHYLKSMT